MSTLILWSKTFYTTTGQYPTLYDYLAITREDLIRWEYHLDNPNISVRPNIFRSTLIPPLVYCGEVSHHMRDSIETYESSVCHTTNMTCPSICQSHQPSVCHTTNMTRPYVCQSHQPSVCHTTNMTRPYVCQSRQPSDPRIVDTTGPSVCQPHESPVRHTTTATCQSVCQAYPSPVRHTIMMTSPSVRQSSSTSDHHTDLTTSPSVCQSRQSSVRRTVELTRPSVCQRQYTSVCHTTTTTSPSVCQAHDTSVRHAMDTHSPSVCQPHDTSVRHTNITRSPSVCPSKQSSDRHTTSKTSPSLCQSRTPSVCHNIIPTSSSVCPSQDSSVCYPARDTRHAVCSSSVTSVLPSANPTVKINTGIPYRNPFPYNHFPGKFPFACTLTESSVHHSDSPSVNLSPFAAFPSKLPGNYGENSTVNYLHETPVKSPTVSTSYDTSVVAPVRATYVPFVCALYVRPVRTSCVTSDVASVCASSVQPVRTSCVTFVSAPVRAPSVPSVRPYHDERQEFLAGYPGTNYGEKNPSEITAKIPYDVTLTLQQAKFPEKTPDTINRVKYLGNFLLTLIWVKFTVIKLRNYVLGGFHVASRTMRCAHGSINKILMEWDPGPTYDVQRLWDPGGPTYSSRSSVPTNLDKLGEPKSYLDYIHLPGLSPLPILVAVKPNLASSNRLEKLDRMGSFRYLPRLDQQA